MCVCWLCTGDHQLCKVLVSIADVCCLWTERERVQCFSQPPSLTWDVVLADQQDVRQRMNLRWGVMPFRLDFSANPEENVDTTFK